MSFTDVKESKYVIMTSNLKGNTIQAATEIHTGELILDKEIPFVWNAVFESGTNFHKYCDECGIVSQTHLLNGLLQTSLEPHISAARQNTTMETIKYLLHTESKINQEELIHCDRNCGVFYCSAKCKQLSEVKGHSWLCKSLQTLSNSSQQLRDIDTKGHFGLAAKVYARIASQCLVNKQKDTSINLSLDAVSVADSLLNEYQSNDFTRTMHAYRTGMFEIDPSMFANIIFPAYFSSQLATPLELTKEIFLQSGVTLWGDDAQQCSAEFLSSEIFSEQFYSMLVGIFVTNCLSVHVASPLDKVWADARHLNHSKNAEESAKMQDVVSFMQHCFDLQQRDGGMEQSDEEERPVTDRFLGMSGSGLFPVFSKTNHSCVCNTSMHGSDRVTVSMYATEAIAQGAEITNCYIHHHSLNGGGGTFRSRLGVEIGDDIDESIDPAELSLGRSDQHQLNAKLTKKQRYRALRQYIFECDCPLCASQEIDSGEESD